MRPLTSRSASMRASMISNERVEVRYGGSDGVVGEEESVVDASSD